MACKCISRLVRLQPAQFTQTSPPSASRNSLDYIRQVHIPTVAQSRLPGASPKSLNHGRQVYLRSRLFAASKFARSWPPRASPNSFNDALGVHPLVHSITASKCISNFARLLPPSVSPNLTDHDLGVYHGVHSIIIFRHTLNCSQALPAASPDIPCVHGWRYRSINENTN